MLQPPPVLNPLPKAALPPPEDKTKKYLVIIVGVVIVVSAVIALAGQGISFFLTHSISSDPTATTTASSTPVRPVGPDVPPDAPLITQPTAVAAGQSAVFDFVSSDANNDNVAYAVDWNGDGTPELWLPAGTLESGPRAYVPSGTHARAANMWEIPGIYKIQARTQDSTGRQSPWVTETITVSAPVTVTVTVEPNTVDSGQKVALSWSAVGATSCTLLGISASATTTSGRIFVMPETSQNYQVYCDGPGGRSYSQVASVQVIAPSVSLRPYASSVAKGSSTTLAVSASNIDSCALIKNGAPLRGFSASETRTVSYAVSDTVTETSVYTLTCSNKAGKSITATTTVSVVEAP